MRYQDTVFLRSCLLACLGAALTMPAIADDPTEFVQAEIARMNVGKNDWPQWGGSAHRNNTPYGKNIPVEWDVDSGKTSVGR